MFEVLLGYLADISDFIQFIIDYIKDIVFMAQGKDEVTSTPSDEEKLQQQSIYNNWFLSVWPFGDFSGRLFSSMCLK